QSLSCSVLYRTAQCRGYPRQRQQAVQLDLQRNDSQQFHVGLWIIDSLLAMKILGGSTEKCTEGYGVRMMCSPSLSLSLSVHLSQWNTRIPTLDCAIIVTQQQIDLVIAFNLGQVTSIVD